MTTHEQWLPPCPVCKSEIDLDPHETLHVYEGDGGVIIRENGNVSTFGVQPREVMAAFHVATAILPEDVAGLVERLRNPADRYCTQSVREEAASLIQSQAAESAADKARIAELTDMVAALADALEVAREDVEHWGGYAGEYFREKHDLDGDLDRISKQAADARALLNRRAEG